MERRHLTHQPWCGCGSEDGTGADSPHATTLPDANKPRNCVPAAWPGTANAAPSIPLVPDTLSTKQKHIADVETPALEPL